MLLNQKSVQELTRSHHRLHSWHRIRQIKSSSYFYRVLLHVARLLPKARQVQVQHHRPALPNAVLESPYTG